MWRVHRRRYEAASHRGSEIVSGRYHRAPDQFPPDRCFPALYTSLTPETAIAEQLRHTHPDDLWRSRAVRLSELRVVLGFVLDVRDPESLGVPLGRLLHPEDYAPGQRLGAEAVARGAEGMLLPSATRLSDNLIIFPTNRRDSSLVTAVGYRELDEVYYVGR